MAQSFFGSGTRSGKTLWATWAAVAALAMAPTSHADILLAGVTEASGGGAASGSSFKNGYLMAIDEVNAKGGVLNQKLTLTQFDIETSADSAKAAVGKAVALKPFAILGPVFSGLTAAVAPLSAPDAIPHFTGGEAASLTRKFHPSLLRTSLSQHGSTPRIGALVTYGLSASKVGLIWIENDFGKEGRETLLAAVKRRSASVVFDESIKPAQKDMTQIVERLKATPAQALLVYVNENEGVDLMKALKAGGFSHPVVSDGNLAAPKVLEAAGAAAEGVYMHMNASAAAPVAAVQSFVSRYQARYGAKPDQNSMKGFIAVQVLKAGIETAGKVDKALFLKTIKDQRLDNKKYPDLLSPISYDFFGDLNRESYYVVIRDGAPQIFGSIRSIDGGSVELANGRMVALDSGEFRAEMRKPAKPTAPVKGR